VEVLKRLGKCLVIFKQEIVFKKSIALASKLVELLAKVLALLRGNLSSLVYSQLQLGSEVWSQNQGTHSWQRSYLATNTFEETDDFVQR
jgi:hypothetical protein